jgi:hypothetical protein
MNFTTKIVNALRAATGPKARNVIARAEGPGKPPSRKSKAL